MTRSSFLLILLLVIVFSSNAQSTEDSVKQAVDKFSLVLKSSNGTMIREAFADNAILQNIGSDKASGKIFLRNESVKDYAKSISSLAVNADLAGI